MVAVLPKFVQQYDVQLTGSQQELLYSYKALRSDCSDQELDNFLTNEPHPIPQCNLCPCDGVYSTVTFDPRRKKRPHKKSLVLQTGSSGKT
jgi:hypothetical protein